MIVVMDYLFVLRSSTVSDAVQEREEKLRFFFSFHLQLYID